MGDITFISPLYQFIAFAFRLEGKINSQPFMAVLRAAAFIATIAFGVFCKFV